MQLAPPLHATIDRTHGDCRGLRLFSKLGIGTSAVNLVGPHLGLPVNAPVATTGQAGPVMRYTRASNMRTTFTPNGLCTGGDVTVIVCAKVTAPPFPGGTQLAGVWDETAGNYNGWLLNTLDNGGSDVGIRFLVGNGGGALGGNLFASGSTDLWDGNFHIFAGSYGRASQQARVYQDGRRRNQQGSLASYNSAATGVGLSIGAYELATTISQTGDVAWIAVFDQQLTDQEIARWSNGQWAMFDLSEEGIVVLEDAVGNSVTTSESVEVQDAGPFFVGDEVVHETELGGTISSTGDPNVFSVGDTAVTHQNQPAEGDIAPYLGDNGLISREAVDLLDDFSIGNAARMRDEVSLVITNRENTLVSGRYRR